MIASILGLGSAIDFIQEIGLEKIEKGEYCLSSQLYDQMQGSVTFLDPQCKGSSILSFTINSLHPVDLSTFLSLEGISVRGGNLCAQPLLTHLGLDAVLRISLGIYNDEQDVEKYIKALKALLK
jgi:cysteine desulfurase/selenocysteine lyase